MMSHMPRPPRRATARTDPLGVGPLLASLRCALSALCGLGREAGADTALGQCNDTCNVEAQAVTPRSDMLGAS